MPILEEEKEEVEEICTLIVGITFKIFGQIKTTAVNM
jgi:hypothetical protein